MSDPIKRRGLMLILSSPSGAGKTTLTRDLLQDKSLDLTLSISVTTRQPSTRVNWKLISAGTPGVSWLMSPASTKASFLRFDFGSSR